MSDMLYRKIGRRYVPVGREWVGFPADGVWFVHDGSQSVIMRIGDMPDPMPLAQMTRYRNLAYQSMREEYDRVTKETLKKAKDGTVSVIIPSLGGLVDAFFKAVAKAEGEHRLQEKAKDRRWYH
jgi:hypothetical protein